MLSCLLINIPYKKYLGSFDIIFFSFKKNGVLLTHIIFKLPLILNVTNIKMDSWTYSILMCIISIRITYQLHVLINELIVDPYSRLAAPGLFTSKS